MSTLDSYTTATRPAAASNTGLCIFNTDTKAIEVSDGTNYLTYNKDGITFDFSASNSHSGIFDGNNDYVDLGVVSTLNGASEQSVTFWFKSDVAGQLPDWGYRTANDKSFGFIDAGSGQRWFLVRNGSSTNSYELTSVIPTDTTTWHHWAAVFNGGNLAVYVDGSEVSGTSSGTQPSSLEATTGDFYIGKFGNISYYADGLYDEFAIFNRALTSTEISNIYNNKIYVAPSAMYRLDNDVTDETGNFNGTNNGVIFEPTDKPY